jgi:hypothetical protein
MNDEMKDPAVERARSALEILREASSDEGAPVGLESKLLQAFRAQLTAGSTDLGAGTRKQRYYWIAAAMAASIIVAAAVRVSDTRTIEAPKPIAKSRPATTQAAPQAHASERATVARTATGHPRPRPRRTRPPELVRGVEELSTEFLPIPYAPALTQVDSGHIVRVRIPASSMRAFGLPVHEERVFERVSADVLVGADGVARAIRFVR